MGALAADRNLLFGILALQMDFISREALIAAMNAWLLQKHRTLADLLEESGALEPAARALLEPLVRHHIEQHGGDPAQSLASLSSVDWIRADLAPIGEADPEVQHSLAQLGPTMTAPGGDPPTTALYPRPGGSTDTRFRIIRFHARGGLGDVFVADDAQLHREVALKQIQERHGDHPESRSRFLLEAEITGGLEHPGIVPVYGLGHYADGRPYYAMRFIKGDSLKEAIKRFHGPEAAGRGPGERTLELQKLLRRFLDVCNAIAYAHSRGVLHRDIKPGNIMVGQYGETLVVDWGLAKIVGKSESSADATLRPPSAGGSSATLPGAAMGTPGFMSPEQAAGQIEQLGPASDVYSLGATLYHLLTGKAPIDVAGLDTEEVLGRVRRGEFPRPRQVVPHVPRAMEAICLKAMAQEPQGRYPTPRALADDLERWLADEPVSAWREPLSARALRWTRRHRTAMTGAAAAVLAWLIGLAAVAVVQSRANDRLLKANAATTKAKMATEEALAESEESRKRAEAVLGFLKDDVLAAARPEGREGGLGVEVTVRKAVDAAEPKIAATFKDQPIIEAEVRNSLGGTYYYLGDAPLAIRQLERALELRQTRLGASHPDTLTSRNNLAVAYRAAGRTDDIIKMLEATLEQRKSNLGSDHPDTLTSRHNLGVAYLDDGRTADGIKMLEATLNERESKLGPDHGDTLTSRTSLGGAYRIAGRTADAIKMHKATLNVRESKLGPDHPDTLDSRNNLAADYLAAGRTADAIKMHEATVKQRESKLRSDHPDTLQSRNNLARAYLEAGRTADAIKIFEANLKQRESRLRSDHPDTFTSRNNLAAAYQAAGRTADAIKMHEANLTQEESKLGVDHPDTLTSRNNLAEAYAAVGRTADAIKMHEANLKQQESKLGIDHPDTLAGRNNLAMAYYAVGRTEDAIKMHEANLAQRESKLGPNHPDTLTSRNNLAAAFQAAGRTALAIRMHEANLAQRESRLGPDHPDTLQSRNNLAAAYYAAGRVADAIKMVEATLKQRESKLGPDHPDTLTSRNNLAVAYQATGRSAQAELLLRDSLERARKRFGPADPHAAGSMGLLGHNLIQQRKWTEAEPILREYLAVREKVVPNDWSQFNTMSQLGEALLGQGKYAEAESLAIEGYSGMKAREVKIPPTAEPRLLEAAKRVVRLYEAWGKPEKAAEWKAKFGLADLPAAVFARP